MPKELVTVVLPIYNVEAYLCRSVESVLTQTYSNLEIILVDDESPDNCPALCDQWALRDSRIRVIHKKNAGLGMARNTGIDNANGDYICFFDSDDYVAPDTIEKCVQAIHRTQAEVVLFGYHNVNRNGEITRTHIPSPQKLFYEGNEVRDCFLPDLMYDDPKANRSNNLWMSMCGAMFSMKVIRRSGWRLVSEREIISEDVYSLIGFYNHVNKVAILQEAFYYYCENGQSLTRTYRPDRFHKIKHFYDKSLEKIDALGYTQNVKHRLAMVFLSFTIAALKQEASAQRPLTEGLSCVRSILHDSTFQAALKLGLNPHDSTARKLLLLVSRFRLHRLCFAMLKIKG